MAFDWGTAFSIGSSLFGGGNTGRKDAAVAQRNQAVYNRAQQWRNNQFTSYWNRRGLAETKRQFDTQVNLHRNTIRHRVEDAKKAGIHPLYALGASSSVSPVAFAGGGAATGAGVSAVIPEGQNHSTLNAVAGALSRYEQRKLATAAAKRQQQLDQYAMRESYWRSRKDEALAQEALSNAARAAAQVNQNQDGNGSLQNAVEKVPQQQFMNDAHGINPAVHGVRNKYRAGKDALGRDVQFTGPVTNNGETPDSEQFLGYAAMVTMQKNAIKAANRKNKATTRRLFKQGKLTPGAIRAARKLGWLPKARKLTRRGTR